MKNLSIYLNGILFVLVAILFYLHFNNKSISRQTYDNHEAKKENSALLFKNIDGTGKVVFVDYDSLVQNYDLFKKMEKDLEARLKKSESELMAKQKKLEEDYQNYMKSQSMLTDNHKAMKEQQLTQQNQELMQMKEERARQFSNQEQELNGKLLNNLYLYFSKLGRQKKFSYIFSYKKGIPGVVYGADSLNITATAIQELNEEYRSQKK